MSDGWYYITGQSQQQGPVAWGMLQSMFATGALPPTTSVWSAQLGNWTPANQVPGLVPPSQPAGPPPPYQQPQYLEDSTIRQLAEYNNISSIIWLVLGILQCASCVLIVAGIWNIYVYTTRAPLTDRIHRRDPAIPRIFEDALTVMIVSAVLNVLLGGVLGIAIFDFYIRDQIMKNGYLFRGRQGAGG